MELNNLIATGAHAKIYKCENYAVKVFDEDYSKTEVLNEALNTARVEEETGLHIPSVNEISKIDGKWAITMEYIEGKTLADLIKGDPKNLQKYINDMVDLHIEIFSKKCPLLNKLKDKMNRQINSLDLDDIKKYELLTRLDGTPKHTKVCHGDFSPHNIIVKEDGTMYVLDWVHAAQGNASADVARSYLLFSLDNPIAADMYLDTFCQKTNTAKRYVQTWLPVVAAAQLTKNRPEEADLLAKWLDVVEYE